MLHLLNKACAALQISLSPRPDYELNNGETEPKHRMPNRQQTLNLEH